MPRLKAVWLAGIVAVLATQVALAAPVTFYGDDFEGYAVGEHPVIWNEMWGQIDDVVTDAWAASPTKSYVSASPSGGWLKRPFVSLADAGALPLPDFFAYQATVRMEATAVSSGVVGFFFVDPRYSNQVPAENAVAFRLDGRVLWYGPTEVQIGTWTPGTDTACTVKVEISFPCETADVYLDGVLAGDDLPAYPKVIPASSKYGAEVSLDKWGFGLADNYTDDMVGKVFVDDVSLGTFVPVFPADVKVYPRTLNLKSRGRYVMAFIEVGECCAGNSRDIDVSTVRLYAGDAEPTYALSHPRPGITDRDRDGLPELRVKFRRADLQAMLEPGKSVEVVIEGDLKSGAAFKGADHLKVIRPGKAKGNGNNGNGNNGNNGNGNN